ncbi:stonin-1 isoform X1 [Conger conger]|uniref:stonin-1 isoform X1 n=1 Tax=Conger conger TaxID=82655 RepID=UPI002A59D999|nr:stonin-1 isoform X1 [Conger conger]XP_061084167.1 stonin-1 isoform X1 [Conger conger]XP_061084168.1 stonin-1 isoform X1 [Conger conger]
MCSMNHPNWVTFEDEAAPLSSPHKPLQSPPATGASPSRPNGLKLMLPAAGDASWSFSASLDSPQTHFNFNGGSCVPANTPQCTPVRETPVGPSPFLCGPRDRPEFFRSFSSPSAATLPSPGSEQAPSEGSSALPALPAFRDDPGHFNPFWGESARAESGSSSSDSDSGSAPPRFFIRTKDGYQPPRDPIHSSYSYICHKLERLRAEDLDGGGGEAGGGGGGGGGGGAPPCMVAVRGAGPVGRPSFVPQGLLLSQRRDGWPMMLRIPEKKNRMSSRQWGPIYLRLLPGGVLQMYYEKGLEKPFKEFQLQPHFRLSAPKLEGYGEPRKIHTVKVEQVCFAERKRYHPKPEVTHEAETEQLLKLGTAEPGDMEDLVASVEEELMKLPHPVQPRRHYEEQEMTLSVVDHLWARLDKEGVLLERGALTRVYCLAFLNGAGDCFLALNDAQLCRSDPVYGSEEEEGEAPWMEVSDCRFHPCVNEAEFRRSRLVKFCPPDGCRVELMRYQTATLGPSELPFSVKAVVTVQGAYVELQAFINMAASSSSSSSSSPASAETPLCENVLVQVPVPEDWVKVSRTVTLLRQKSLKARMNRNACLGSVSAAESQPVMQVSVGTVKYENVYGAIVWRIDRLPAKNMAVDHPHSFSCKLELGSDQEVPTLWYPFVTVEFEVAEAVVSGTKVKSLGTESDIQPQKHVGAKTHYHCQVEIEKKWIETESRRQPDCATQ